jgi:hypothetical protein
MQSKENPEVPIFPLFDSKDADALVEEHLKQGIIIIIASSSLSPTVSSSSSSSIVIFTTRT